MPESNQKKITQIAYCSWLVGLIVIVGAFPVRIILSYFQDGSLKETIPVIFFLDFLPICGSLIGAYAIFRGLRAQQRAPVLHGFAGFLLNLCLAGLTIPHLPSFWEKRPICHKQVRGSMDDWIDDHTYAYNYTNAYPNVSGFSSNSLSLISMSELVLAHHYKYVPGLRQNDPDYLVLMYLDKPTRCIWHADSPTFFRPKKWVVVPPGFYFPEPFNAHHNGECGDWIDTEEFKTRLQKTLDFLKENNRPFWTNVVAEQTEFLKSIKE